MSESPVATGGGPETNDPGSPRAATGVEELGVHPNPTRPPNRTKDRTCSRPERPIIVSPQHLELGRYIDVRLPVNGKELGASVGDVLPEDSVPVGSSSNPVSHGGSLTTT
jgi:hypothetical protein